jgi:hypothetical protein
LAASQERLTERVLFLTREEIDALLHEHGFDEMEHIGREAQAMYFGGYDDVEIAGAQALVCAVVHLSSASAKETTERAQVQPLR